MSLTISKNKNKIMLTFSTHVRAIVIPQITFPATFHFISTVTFSPYYSTFSIFFTCWRYFKREKRMGEV